MILDGLATDPCVIHQGSGAGVQGIAGANSEYHRCRVGFDIDSGVLLRVCKEDSDYARLLEERARVESHGMSRF